MNNNEEKRSTGAHNLILEERGSLTVTGVSDIDSFDEETVVVYTDLGELTVRGSGLHINKIDVDAGELELERYVRQHSAGIRSNGIEKVLAGFPRWIFCEDVSIDDDRCYCGKGNDAVFPVTDSGCRVVFAV